MIFQNSLLHTNYRESFLRITLLFVMMLTGVACSWSAPRFLSDSVGVRSHPMAALTSAEATYMVTDDSLRTVTLINVDEFIEGIVVVPDSICADSICYRVTSIGSYAFSPCEGFIAVVVPRSVTSLGYAAFGGAVNLAYIDARNAVDLAVPSVSRSAGAFSEISDDVIIYLPHGNTAHPDANVVSTWGYTDNWCEQWKRGNTIYNIADLNSGKVAYDLCAQTDNSRLLFGQQLGTDRCPMPLDDSTRLVCKATYLVKGVERHHNFNNYHTRIDLPSSTDMKVNAPVKRFWLVDAVGDTIEVTDSTLVTGDMRINVEFADIPGDCNNDGLINSLDITAAINVVLNVNTANVNVANADYNYDGIVNALDITALIASILHNETPATGIKFNVLALGNSYTCDALAYVPAIIRAIAPQVELTMGIACRGNSTLQQHYEENIKQNLVPESYYLINPSGRWNIVWPNDRTEPDIITERQWDLVVLHQNSTLSREYDNYQPYLDSIMTWINDTLEQVPDYAWLLIPAYPDGQSLLDGSTSDQMWLDVCNAAQRVIEETDVKTVIPCGTAIQNARHTSLASLGDYGYLSHDGRHLQEGIPSLIEAYAVAATLLRHLGVEADIRNENLVINQDWINNYGVPQASGTPIGMNGLYREIARQCALAALKHPYVITPIATP